VTAAGWVTFLGVVITAVVSLLSAHFSARAARRATDRVAELDAVRLQLETRDAQIVSWRTDVETLRRERIEDDARCREQVAELVAHITRLRGKLRDHGAPLPDPPTELGDTDAGRGGTT
jgi:hypothetical protein